MAQEFGIGTVDPAAIKSTIIRLSNNARQGRSNVTSSTGGITYTYTYNKDKDVVEVKDSTGIITAKIDKNNQIIEE